MDVAIQEIGLVLKYLNGDESMGTYKFFYLE